jgi:tetratricopeptide (TPR) repeat protein
MADNPRIEELRGRVQRDPSSIAFAQLGEEYRRAGQYEEAIETCRTGLSRHPGYLSARVTLGRALIETRELDAAEAELSLVLKAAPENLAAIRGLADIHHQRGDLVNALTFYRRALALARHDPDLEQTVDDIERMRGTSSSPAEVAGGLSFAQARDEFLSFAPPIAPAPRQQPTAAAPVAEESLPVSDILDDLELESLPDLEALLSALTVHRRGSGSSS